ncbi:MAG: DNA polymerase III subunit beta [Chloroflexi bacterium]|nr:DNA polymerase III subunit beta [Chloroflexota bacterium]
MKLLVDRDQLVRLLSTAQSVVDRRAMNPILGCVCIDSRLGSVKVTATDLETEYSGNLSTANPEAPGVCVVGAADLFAIVRALPNANVELHVKDTKLTVSSGRSVFKLPLHPEDQFPTPTPFAAAGAVNLPDDALRTMIDRVLPSIGDSSRYGLNGVHIEADGGRMLFVSTDGHRLSLAGAKVEGKVAMPRSSLVPEKALNVIKRLLRGSAESVTLEWSEDSMRLTVPGHSVWLRLIHGEFPSWRDVVPKPPHKNHALMDRHDLMAACKRAQIVVSGAARAVEFAWGEQECLLSVSGADGEITDVVPMSRREGKTVSMGLNVNYLVEILAVMEGTVVQADWEHALAPVVLSDPSEQDAQFIVMPMRLN